MTTTSLPPRPPSPSRLAAGLAAAVIALACLTAGAAGSPARSKPVAEAGGAPGGADETEADRVATWKEVERLVGEQKMREALAAVERILAAARRDGTAGEVTRALVERTQITLALSGYETAVEELAAAERPDDARSRLVLDLVYGQALHAYLNAYRWEIEQRERVGGDDGVADLRLWTREQIAAEIYRAYARAWEGREAWGGEPVSSLELYLEPNDYPQPIRGTLRDAVSYLWAELLADSSLWRPEHANEIYRLDFDALTAGQALEPAAWVDPGVHPLRLLAAVLGDLERWHAGERPEAAFEARRTRLDFLWSHAPGTDRAALQSDLRAALDRLGAERPWWSMGMATLARWLQEGDEADRLIQALEAARAGQRRHPDTVGGKVCQAIAGGIEAPSFSLQSMLADGPGRRSLQVTHSNLERLHFRAFRGEVIARIEGSTDRQPFPDHTEVPRLLGRRPAAEWTVELPRPGDYRPHETYVTPPLTEPGLYTLVASARADFAREENLRIGVNLIVTGLALVTRPDDEGFEVTVRDGTTGAGLSGVEVMAFRADWKAGHRRVASATTPAGGRVHLDLPKRGAGRGESYFLAARRGDDATADLSLLSLPYERERTETDAALLYTDRSVYRPGQEVLWKAVVYGGGVPVGDYRVKPGQDVTVALLDPNGQEAARAEAKSNDFGSAAGRFSVPAGRPLGGWTLRVTTGGRVAGSSQIQVEEYKRPTFEVTLDEPAEELRLNHPAKVGGEARYYFGLPVTEGEVRWTVRREPLFPRWWFSGWWRGRGFASRQEQTQLVAAGEAEIAADGTFAVEFLPEVDERDAEPGLTYLYRLEAEVTDAGGETRSAERRYRLGFVSVEAQVAAERGFWPAGEPIALPVERRDLDGAPRAGAGRWRLVSVEQPAMAVPPADLPVPPPPAGDEGAERFLTEGDRQRPRWQPGYQVEEILRLWDDGEEVAAGSVQHGEDGAATIELPALVTGVYRLRYETDDARGATFETARELIVAADGGEPLALPAVLLTAGKTATVGGALQVLVGSGLPGQELVLELFHGGERIERRYLSAPSSERPMPTRVLSIPIGPQHRGGLGVRLTALADYQPMTFSETIQVPWDDRRLDVRFATFRDLLRPGGRETWRVEVRGADEGTLAAGTAELLAYMYDRSLDLFAPHEPPRLDSVYPTWLSQVPGVQTSLGVAWPSWWESRGFGEHPPAPSLQGDRLRFYPQYGVGGPGSRAYFFDAVPPPPRAAAMRTADGPQMEVREEMAVLDKAAVVGSASMAGGASLGEGAAPSPPPPPPEPRSNFAETAFWEPQLLIGEDGGVAFEFTVPDSVTEWSVWAHALTRDLRFGSIERQARTVKELLVRPYLPRFLRERDRAELRVVVNNSGEEALSGEVEIRAIDTESGEDRSAELGLEAGQDGAVTRPFEVAPDGSATVRFRLAAPARVGSYALEVWARAGDLADGERRPLPVLPGRLHLSESRFAALSGEDRRSLTFAALAAQAGAGADPTLINDRLVVTLDGQLFYSVLSALPYLVDYPYECTEQTLNRFVSSGVVSSVFERYPAVAAMAAKLAAERDTRLEAWEEDDPNRDLLLEETPWLRQSRGGAGSGTGLGAEDDPALIKVLDPEIAAAQRDASLARLVEAQTASGGFPWWPGGPPSPYMTVYMLHGLSRAIERDVEVPRSMVASAWRYLHSWWTEEVTRELASGETCCVELVTFLNYVLSSYPDPSWAGNVFLEPERRQMLDQSFAHWQKHSPLLKGYLALTLERAGRGDDAQLVFDAVLDSARTDPDLGTYWAPEERSWLWYNDTVEGHSFALYTLTELAPDDARRHGLVQWLMLDKKLGHWKSTRATAEAIWALVHYLEHEGSLGAVEEARVTVGPIEETFRFEPDEYTGARNRVVIENERIEPASMSTVVVEKKTPGLLFASATWHFSTERLPETGSEEGLFTVHRRFFRRLHDGREWTLAPLSAGERLEVGDQVEVQLSITAKHAAEYVHLRDPRGAGFEPESLASGYRWDLGIGYYEEIRDSGTNFFVEWLPAGEYTLTHRLRAATAGTFRTGPATLQSMYAPEFTAYSSGVEIEVAGE